MGINIAGLFSSTDEVSPDRLRKILNSTESGEIEIVDVREPAEYERGHLPGAKLIPLSSLPDRIGELDKSKKIVTY